MMAVEGNRPKRATHPRTNQGEKMTETYEQMVARVKASAYIPTGVNIMAQKVKMPKGRDFQFKTAKSGGSKYDWDGWFDGSLLLIEQSVGEKDDKGNVVKVTEKRDYE